MVCADALPDAAFRNLSKIGDANRFVYYDDYNVIITSEIM